MTLRMLLARHGQTAYNAERRFMGQLDVPLDDVGRAQAQAVAARLSTELPAAIYSSTLKRALETARAIQAAIPSHPELRTDVRLIEGQFGDWEGRKYDDLRANDAERLARWEDGRLDNTPPNGESLEDLAERVQAAYRDICAAHSNQTVLVVAHGGTIQVMLTLALGLPLEDYRKLWVSNASISELLIDTQRTVLFRLNDFSHIGGSK